MGNVAEQTPPLSVPAVRILVHRGQHYTGKPEEVLCQAVALIRKVGGGSVRLHAFGGVSHQMITISKEDYLKAIAEAEVEGQTVIPATLAHWLSVTRPAVTFALKRLKKDGLVSIKKEGHICLTSQGREIAERTMVRHHLIERMLSEMFGMAWYEIHDEAERLEHAVSPAFEKKLVERLGNKDICPHGNGLSLRNPAERRKRGMRLLSEAEAGFKYVVASVYERDRKLLEFFEKEGLRPGVHIAVEARNYDGTVSLSVDKTQIRLGASAAERIWVSKS